MTDMKISDKLKENLKELCIIQSDKFKKLKNEQASEKDIETLEATISLISIMIDQIKKINHSW